MMSCRASDIVGDKQACLYLGRHLQVYQTVLKGCQTPCASFTGYEWWHMIVNVMWALRTLCVILTSQRAMKQLGQKEWGDMFKASAHRADVGLEQFVQIGWDHILAAQRSQPMSYLFAWSLSSCTSSWLHLHDAMLWCDLWSFCRQTLVAVQSGLSRALLSKDSLLLWWFYAEVLQKSRGQDCEHFSTRQQAFLSVFTFYAFSVVKLYVWMQPVVHRAIGICWNKRLLA